MTETTERIWVSEDQTNYAEKGTNTISLPVFMLTLLGTLIAVLGLFAAGEVGLVIIGLASVAVAGLIQVVGKGQ